MEELFMITRQKKGLYLILCLIFILPSFFTFADWLGPQKIVEGTWGKEIGQFYYQFQDTQDAFPRNIGVDKDSNIIIPDEGNKRIYIYTKNGKLLNIIQKPAELSNVDIVFGKWPTTAILLSYNNLIAFPCEYRKIPEGYQPLKQCVIDYRGKITLKAEIAETFAIKDGFIMLKNDKYAQYSLAGQFLKAYDTQPSELGIINERSSGANKIESTVEYPDHIYKVNTAIGKYSRDMFANFYDILFEYKKFESEVQPVICYNVIRVDRCTAEEYMFEPPRSEFAGYSPEEANSPAPRQEVKIAYGEPIVSPLGDLYCWARTKTHYKILKWTWQGPEDAPQSLQISAGLSGLKLNWEKPVKDKETVTGYQILRSPEVCGPFNEVTTVKKDKLSFEDQTIKPPWKYYYVVKAVRDKKVSGDSNKVYMQWK